MSFVREANSEADISFVSMRSQQQMNHKWQIMQSKSLILRETSGGYFLLINNL